MNPLGISDHLAEGLGFDRAWMGLWAQLIRLSRGREMPGMLTSALNILQEGFLYSSQMTLAALFSLVLSTVMWNNFFFLVCENLTQPTWSWTLWHITGNLLGWHLIGKLNFDTLIYLNLQSWEGSDSFKNGWEIIKCRQTLETTV